MLISIIIPAYNAEQFIDRCIQSIYKTGPSDKLFEVIVINDGSKDNTLNRLKEISANYDNLIVFNQQNGGVSVARNTGINEAKGEYVLFLDADDELVEGAFKKVCDYLLENKPIDMLVTSQIRNDGKKEWQSEFPSLSEHKKYNGVEAFKNKYIRTNAGGGICRTAFLKEHKISFPEGVKNSEDALFFAHLQVYAESIVYYNLLLYRIYEVVGSASRANVTTIGKEYINTVKAAITIKNNLCTSREKKAIFDCFSYKAISDITFYYTISETLSYCQLKRDVNIKELLPLDVNNMYMFVNKARLINRCYALFYLLSWIKHTIK